MSHPIRAEIVWKKDMHVGPPCPLAMQDERIWIFSAEGFNASRFETTVWDEKVIPTWNHKHHKNEKPEQLMLRAVSLVDADIILDPFAGSGTTLVAAKQLGRRFLGFELEQKYVDICNQRLAQEVLSL
jgi:DNA modification methylase